MLEYETLCVLWTHKITNGPGSPKTKNYNFVIAPIEITIYGISKSENEIHIFHTRCPEYITLCMNIFLCVCAQRDDIDFVCNTTRRMRDREKKNNSLL